MTDWKERYHAAHKEWFARTYPKAYADGHYTKPVMPKYKTANGLTTLICSYLKWVNGIGNRINVTGRQIGGKWIKSATLVGTADISAILPNGKTIYLEVKVGNDRPRKEQLLMQERIRAIGGVYEFVKLPEEFFYIYDREMNKP
jgi:hypothetical protein